MTIFDNLINIDEYGEIAYNQWIEWYHFLIPNQPICLRDKLRNTLFLFDIVKNAQHCLVAILLKELCQNTHHTQIVIVKN